MTYKNLWLEMVGSLVSDPGPLRRAAESPSAVAAGRSKGCYLTLILGQTLTFKGSPCWCSSGPSSGDGSP